MVAALLSPLPRLQLSTVQRFAVRNSATRVQVPKHELHVVDDGVAEKVELTVKLPGKQLGSSWDCAPCN